MSKNINFLSTPSHRHHKNVNRWYVISCSGILTLLVSLAFVSAQQVQHWYSAQKELQKQSIIQQKAHGFLVKREHLSHEKTSLLKKTEEWEKYTHRAKKPSDMLNAIKENTETNNITSLRMVQHSVRFQMQVKNAQDGIKISQQLSSTTIFDEVRFTSFKSTGDGAMNATMEGQLSA